MQFKTLSIILSITSLLISACYADDQQFRYFTSDNVVYRYAVLTSTLEPPRVVVKTLTHVYTTYRVYTLQNNEVSTSTQEITSLITTSTSASNPPQATNTVTDEQTTPIMSYAVSSSTTPEVKSTTSTTPEIKSTTSTDSIPSISHESRDTVTVRSVPVSEIKSSSNFALSSDSSIPTSSTTSTSNEPDTSAALSSIPQSTTTKAPTTTTAPTSTTSVFTERSGTTSKSAGTCYVYYDDDEYYSTFYITSPGQSVDAATTMTKTRTVYQTSTVI